MNHRTKKILSYFVTAVVIIAAAFWVCSKFVHLGNVEFTDNAQVNQQIVPVNSRVQGYIKEIRFNEYQPVKKGDTLIIIDDSDMRLRVAQASADYQNAVAGRAVADHNVGVASANAAVSKASIAEAKVLMDMAKTDFERYEKLLSQDAVTRQQYDAAKQTMMLKRLVMKCCHVSIRPHHQLLPKPVSVQLRMTQQSTLQPLFLKPHA